MIIKASKFVKRQTRISEFSYCCVRWNDVEELAMEHFEKASRPGYRDGVVLVTVPPNWFYSAVVPITKDIEFETIFEARRKGEKPFKKSVAYGKKVNALHVDIILYRKDVLEEDETDRESLTGADWEIVSLNCSPYDYDLPMTPTAMARNQLAGTEDGKGGTKADYTGEEFAKAITFWNTHTLVRERENPCPKCGGDMYHAHGIGDYCFDEFEVGCDVLDAPDLYKEKV